jgi:hypothetical protein
MSSIPVFGLFIGLNYANNTQNIPELDGCVPDCLYMKTYFEKTFPEIDSKLILENQATRSKILQELDTLKNKIISSSGEDNNKKSLVFFYYSGHGSFVFENQENPKDELDGRDEVIVPFDGQLISDDEFYQHFLSGLPSSCTCIMIIDACNSGTFADLDCNYKLVNQNITWNWTETELSSELQKPENIKTKATVYCLSAASDDEYAREGYFSRYQSYRGYFTVALQEKWLNVAMSQTLFDLMLSIQNQYLGSLQTMNITTTEHLLSIMTLETLFGDLITTNTKVIMDYPSTWTTLPTIEYNSFDFKDPDPIYQDQDQDQDQDQVQVQGIQEERMINTFNNGTVNVIFLLILVMFPILVNRMK